MVQLEDEFADICVSFGCEEVRHMVALVYAFGGFNEGVGGELCRRDYL